ncbi:MAG TPA: glycan-binding surface protein [Chitinophagaceae bacterium]|nr:glycan-binding surface protein [Chitinophagaceae bacterium]
MKKILFLIALAGIVFIACKKTSSGGGQPVIKQVRTVDTTKRDSFFTQAMPGTLIVIQGENLGGLQAVYFNDTSAYFNPAYATDNNIIITIPSTAQTSATDPSVQNVIKVVTDHGTATYSFTLYLMPPQITSISFDNSGTIVYINGSNFEGIQKITFPVPGADTALSYEVNKEYTQIKAAIPPGVAFTDSLRVYCTFGTGSFPYPPPMTVTSVSNENGAAGSTITINGTNFIGITKVIFPGGIEGKNIQVKSVTQLTVEVPPSISTTDSLKIEGALGIAAAPQLYASYNSHPSPGYLSTFEQQWASDNTSFVGWTGGYADEATTTANYPKGTGASAVLLQSSPMSANAGPTSQGNPGLLQLNEVPWVANTSQSIDGYSLKFELYVKTPWTAGEIWIGVGGWYGWSSYTARFAPWETADGGKYQPTGWVTVTIPLKKFLTGNEFWQTAYNASGNPASKFSDFPSTAIAFMIANDQAKAVPANSINIAIDNVRIVKGQ